ncbi:MAG: tRNA dihydrouridine synthase DusB [Acidobacteria bacterium]|nr:tRNA dihydrouridine synthase DusB [Acidobacteriota bacterium]
MTEYKPLSIGPHQVWPPVVLAPMAGVTNAPFRVLCRRQGAGLYVNQMLTARAVVERHARTLELAEFAPEEEPRSLQLYGTDATYVTEAVRMLVGDGKVDHIDMNFGCPMKKVTRHGGGAALPVRHRLLADIVSGAVRAAGDVPITIKFRMGVDDEHLTFLETGRIAVESGVSAVALHARTAEQLYSGTARWDAIGELKAAVSEIPVLGNGDIWEPADALAMMDHTGCDGVVIGRGCLGRPWLFAQLAAVFEGSDMQGPPTLGEICDTMIEHATLLVEWFGEHRGIRDFRKHSGWYLQGFPIGGEKRRALNQLRSLDELVATLALMPRDIAFPREALRMRRGHTAGPRPVTLPVGHYSAADALTLLAAAAETLISGG